MPKLIESFTFGRNAFKRSTLLSAKSAADHIDLVASSASLDKTQSNIVRAPASYRGFFEPAVQKTIVPETEKASMRMSSRNETDAWLCLEATSLCVSAVPN